MIKIVAGNKIKEFPLRELHKKATEFDKVEIDLGTGDGRYVYKMAKFNPKTLFLGIDPSHKQLETYSKKVNKDRLNNALFVWSSLENLNHKLDNLANKLNIILPWGTLLQHIAKATPIYIKELANMVRSSGQITIIMGYHPENEPNEIERLDLDNLSLSYIENKIVPEFEKNGFSKVKLIEVTKDELNEIESTWSKKLTFGQNRPIFKVELIKD